MPILSTIGAAIAVTAVLASGQPARAAPAATTDTVTVTIPKADQRIAVRHGTCIRFRARAVSSAGDTIVIWGIGNPDDTGLTINRWGLVHGCVAKVRITVWVSAFDTANDGGSSSFRLVGR